TTGLRSRPGRSWCAGPSFSAVDRRRARRESGRADGCRSGWSSVGCPGSRSRPRPASRPCCSPPPPPLVTSPSGTCPAARSGEGLLVIVTDGSLGRYQGRRCLIVKLHGLETRFARRWARLGAVGIDKGAVGRQLSASNERPVHYGGGQAD